MTTADRDSHARSGRCRYSNCIPDLQRSSKGDEMTEDALAWLPNERISSTRLDSEWPWHSDRRNGLSCGAHRTSLGSTSSRLSIGPRRRPWYRNTGAARRKGTSSTVVGVTNTDRGEVLSGKMRRTFVYSNLLLSGGTGD